MGTELWNIAFAWNGGNPWNDATGLSFGAGHGLRMRTFPWTEGMPSREMDEAIGDVDPVSYAHDAFAEVNAPLGDMWARYEGIERVLAFCMGADTVTVNGSDASKRDHKMVRQTSLSGIYGALAYSPGGVGNVILHKSVKLTGFELKQDGGRMSLTPSGQGTVRDDSTNPSLASVTQPTTALIIPFRELAFRIKDAEAAALGAGDLIPLVDMSLRHDAKEAGEAGTGNTDGSFLEPELDGFPETILRVVGQKYTSAWDTFLQDLYPLTAAGSKRYKADLIWTGPTNGSATRVLKIELPNLVLLTPERKADGPRKRVQPSLEFRAIKPEVQHAGMPTDLVPMIITVEGSDNTASPLT